MLEDQWLSDKYSVGVPLLRLRINVLLGFSTNLNTHPNRLLVVLGLLIELRLLIVCGLLLILGLLFKLRLLVLL